MLKPTLLAAVLCGFFSVGLGSPEANAQKAKPGRGEILFNRCRACHTLDASEKQRLGPHLEGLFGRAAGSVDGFKYSKALSGSGFTWTEEKLDAWLENPQSFLPGNRMSFAGVRSEQDRKDLITYLKSATK